MVHRAGYLFLLSWLLIAFTRGYEGVTFVGHHLLRNWKLFCHDFDRYVADLVTSARKHCALHGLSSLSHIESFHTGLSGLPFLMTLRTKANRHRLVRIATWGSNILGRLLEGAGKSRLRPDEFLELSVRIRTMVLAVRKRKNGLKKEVHVGNYNQQDKMRCLEHTIEHVLGCKEMSYTDAIHKWYARRQSKKMTADSKALVEEYKLSSSASMKKYINDLQKWFPDGTVSKATANVNTCELRQSINTFGSSRMMWRIVIHFTGFPGLLRIWALGFVLSSVVSQS